MSLLLLLRKPRQVKKAESKNKRNKRSPNKNAVYVVGGAIVIFIGLALFASKKNAQLTPTLFGKNLTKISMRWDNVEYPIFYLKNEPSRLQGGKVGFVQDAYYWFVDEAMATEKDGSCVGVLVVGNISSASASSFNAKSILQKILTENDRDIAAEIFREVIRQIETGRQTIDLDIAITLASASLGKPNLKYLEKTQKESRPMPKELIKRGDIILAFSRTSTDANGNKIAEKIIVLEKICNITSCQQRAVSKVVRGKKTIFFVCDQPDHVKKVSEKYGIVLVPMQNTTNTADTNAQK